MADMEYCHTQKAPLHWLGHGLAIVLLVSAWLSRATPAIEIILAVTACVTIVFAFSFRYLTVTGQGEWPSVRFGPLPIFGKRIPYSDITAVKAGCSSLMDGWGIHYIPGRGSTYNLWGFGCVVLHLGKRIVRIGTDDVENLVAFVSRKIKLGDF